MMQDYKKRRDEDSSLKRMRSVGFFGAGVLVLLLGFNASTYAQQDQHKQDGKTRNQEQQDKTDKHQQQPQQDQAKQQQQQRGQPPQQQRAQQQGQQRQQPIGRPSEQGQRVQQSEARNVWQQHRASNWQSEHRTWQQRGGYAGFRIPDDRFRGYFGSGHAFRIYSQPLVIFGGYPSFQYGGFWFSLLDPWPEYWAADWYDRDDVYIDYAGDGYYLYNRTYPQTRIAIEVYLGD